VLYVGPIDPIIFAEAQPEGVALATAKLPVLTPAPPQSPRAKKLTVASLVFNVSWP
jgi:hypothetical protein